METRDRKTAASSAALVELPLKWRTMELVPRRGGTRPPGIIGVISELRFLREHPPSTQSPPGESAHFLADRLPRRH